MRSVASLVFGVAIGCGGGSLASLQTPTLTVQNPGTPIILTVGFSNSGCPSVSGAKATMNGAALTATSLGGPASGGLLAGCQGVVFMGTSPGPGGDPVHFAVTDGTTTLSMDCPDYFAARSLALLSPDGGLFPQNEVTAQAVPSTDTFNAAFGVSAQFTPDAAGGPSFTIKSVPFVSGPTVEFVVPWLSSPVPDGGTTGTLSVTGESQAQVSSCGGATACTAQLSATYATPAFFRP